MAEETEVVLSANVTPYERSVDSATRTTDKMLDAVVKLTTAIDGAFKSAGRTMQIGGAGMVASITAMGFAAGRLDQQMSHLQASMTMLSKTQNEYQSRMKDYSTAVTNLRTNFGMTSQEAINLSTQLGKLGQSSRSINELSDSFTRLGAVTGEGVNGLAQAMTQLQRQMGTQGVMQTKVFTSALAELSTAAGVSATGVLQFSQAIAPVAKVSGMTQKEVMGVATAFQKAGADGYVAANAFNKVLTDINRSIQYGSPELKAYADLIGVSVSQFKSMPRIEIVSQFFEAINKQGPAAIKTLERFGLDGVRNLRAVQAVANAGGINSAISNTIGTPSDQERFQRASEEAFNGLNDQMKKMAENGKMIAEAFGQGILPVMESVARAINSVLSPLNQVLQSLGKLPGGAMLLGGLALGAAGAIVKNVMGFSSAGALYGAGRTLRQGYRAPALGRSVGQELNAFSDAEQRAYISHQAWLRGEDTEGNYVQHKAYGAASRVRNWMDAHPDVPEGGRSLGARAMRGARAVGNFGLGMLGGAIRAGLDPLSIRAQMNNFDRDKNVQLMSSAHVQQALGWDKVADRWNKTFGVRHLDPLDGSAKEVARGMNTAADSSKKFGTVMRTLGHEGNQLAKSLIQASFTTGKMIDRGAGALIDYGGARLRAGVGSGVARLGTAISDTLGGPVAMGMTGLAMGASWWMNENRKSAAINEQVMNNPDSQSPFAIYAAAVGEAALATKSFTQALAESKAALAMAGPVTAKPSSTVVEAASKPGKFTNEALNGATLSQAKTIAAGVLANNPSDNVKKALQEDLLRQFGTDESGQAIVTAIMGGPQVMDLSQMARMTYDKQKWYQLSGNEAGANVATQTGSLIQEQIANTGANAQQRSQITVSSLNATAKGLWGSGQLKRGGVDNVARGWVKGILGEAAKPEDTEIVARAIQQEGPENLAAIQKRIAESDSNIGRALKSALATSGPNFDKTTTTLPTARSYASSWTGVVGMDRAALDRLRGVTIDYTLQPGDKNYNVDTQVGALNKTATAIFGQGTQGGYGKAVSTALGNPQDTAAQWTGMAAIATASLNITGSFSKAVSAIDEMTYAAGGATTALGQLNASARARVRQAQTEAMGFMTEGAQIKELVANYREDLATDISRPTETSGENREGSRQQVQARKQQMMDRLKSFALSLREFNVSRDRAEEDFARQQKYAIDDYYRQRMYAEDDFQRSRRRAEEDFQHNLVLMTKQTAKSMTDIYSRIAVQRTWSGSNLVQNMAEQQQRLDQQQANLKKLRSMGMSNATIEMMGLNDPAQMQQAARLLEDALSDPRLIAAMNAAAKKRMATGKKIATDPSNTQWQEMSYSFRRQMAHGEEDFKRGMDRQAEQFEISMERMTDQFKRSQDRAADDLNRSMENISLGFGELQKLALDTLQGAAKEQMASILADLNSVSTDITDKTGSTIREINALFQGLGLSTSNQLTMPNGGKLMTGTITVGGQRINAGLFQAEGGEIPGYSPHPKADNIPIRATAGEFMQPVSAVQYYGKDFMEKVRTKSLPKEAVQHLAEGGMVYQQMTDWVHKNLPGVAITSSYRPGAITALGNTSMHAKGKALDLAPSMETFNKILGAFGSKIYQLFYSPADGRTILRGKPWHMDSVTKGDHWDHVHWAMQSMLGGGGFGGWDGTYESLLKMVKGVSGIKAFNKTMANSELGAFNDLSHDKLAKYVALRGFMMSRRDVGVDQDFTGNWSKLGGVYKKATRIGVGEAGPEAVLPLDQRGVNFIFELMKKNSFDSKRALVAANGVPTTASTANYYSRIDKSTQITGPITVQAQDPDEMLRKIEAKKKLDALKGRHS